MTVVLDYEKLRALAVAATTARRAVFDYKESISSAGGDASFTDEFLELARRSSLADNALEEALETDGHMDETVLALLDRVEVGQVLYALLAAHTRYDWPHVTKDCGLCIHRGLRRWESLLGSERAS